MSKNPVPLSVVVISYNGENFIEDCLESINKTSNNTEVEIILVDNNSSDRTVSIIKEKFEHVRLIENKKNLGFTEALNIGIKNSSGRIILILNQDTIIVDKAVERMAKRLQEDDKIGCLGPKFIGFDGKLQKSARAFPKYRDLFFEFCGLSYILRKSPLFSRWKMGWFDHLSEKRVDQPMGAALMFRRRLIDQIGYFDESFPIFFSDVDFCRRVIKAGFYNLYFPEATIKHYLGGSTERKKAKMIIESHRFMFRYFKKYATGPGSMILAYFWAIPLYISAFIRAGWSQIFK